MADLPQRLVAVVAADVAGYTRLMELDEAGTVQSWRRARAEAIDPIVALHHGRIVKLTGDGFLAEFPTVENAVRAALEMQETLARLFASAPPTARLAFRMGVNVGDVWVDADDIYGAGVNVAARLQALAEPGGICVSGAVYEAVKHKIAAHYDDRGLQVVKNVSAPIQVWCMRQHAPIEVSTTPIRALANDATFGMAAELLGDARTPSRLGHAVRGAGTRYAATAVAAAGLGAALVWFLSRDADAEWLRNEAIPEIERHVDAGDWQAAYAIAKEAERRVPDDPELAELWPRFAWRVTIPSEPSGARVSRRPYGVTDAEWELLGTTPLEDLHVPFGLSELEFELEGYRPLHRTLGGEVLVTATLPESSPLGNDFNFGTEMFRLDTADTLPDGKVRVPGWEEVVNGELTRFRDFFLDRHEVTNAEFKEFVDAGGYREPRYWDPIVHDGENIPWDQAMTLFVDRTGRPGPSTWEAGDYPEGQGDFPVGGVSWYEAAAYARFKGQELPTLVHWRRSVPFGDMPWLLPRSNLDGSGPIAVGSSGAMSFMGAFDLAGNVREWSATAVAGTNDRLILGGGWSDDPSVASVGRVPTPPLDRSPNNGFRLAITQDEPAVAARARAPVELFPPFREREPVSDEVYAAYGRMFSYEPKPLNATIHDTGTTRLWRRERISFDAAYGGERMVLYLYLPTSGAPPYQTVIYWPGAAAIEIASIDDYSRQMDFIVKNGRAVAFPVYKGTFERGDGDPMPPFDAVAYRDNAVDGVKDLRRTIDYLETRPDIASDAIAFFGHSWGGVNGASVLAQEPRIDVGVIYVGFIPAAMPPEVDPVNALPRVDVPVLLLSGEFDGVPLENARRYFDLIGTAPDRKRHVIAPGGHFVPRELLIRETLDWIDTHLGAPRS